MKPRFGRPVVGAFLILLAGGCENLSRNPSPEVFDIRYVTVIPQVITRVAPVMPPGFRRRTNMPIEATVDFIVDERGQVQMARVMKADSQEFADAALTAVQQWRFSPGVKDGRVVQTHMQVPMVFSANEM
jgi:protein TonB